MRGTNRKLFETGQFYSNTRVLTQVNTNQHESTRINTSPTRVNTCQLDQEIIIVYRSLVVTV